MKEYIRDHRTTPDGFTVERYSIITTPVVVYTVLEPAASDWSSHSTITTLDGVKMGRVSTRGLPADLDKLPAGSAERSAAVREFYEDLWQACAAEIVEAYPHLLTIPHRVTWCGDIETREGPGKEPKQ